MMSTTPAKARQILACHEGGDTIHYLSRVNDMTRCEVEKAIMQARYDEKIEKLEMYIAELHKALGFEKEEL